MQENKIIRLNPSKVKNNLSLWGRGRFGNTIHKNKKREYS